MNKYAKISIYILYIVSIVSLYMGYWLASTVATITGGFATVIYFKISIIQRIPILDFVRGAFRDRSYLYFRYEIDTVSFLFVLNIFSSLLAGMALDKIPALVVVNLSAHAIYIAIIFVLSAKL